MDGGAGSRAAGGGEARGAPPLHQVGVPNSDASDGRAAALPGVDPPLETRGPAGGGGSGAEASLEAGDRQETSLEAAYRRQTVSLEVRLLDYYSVANCSKPADEIQRCASERLSYFRLMDSCIT